MSARTELQNSREQDLLLACKCAYGRRDIVDLLRIVLCEHNGVDPKYMNLGDIAHCLIGDLFPLIYGAINTDYRLREFLIGPHWRTDRVDGRIGDLIASIADLLRMVSVRDGDGNNLLPFDIPTVCPRIAELTKEPTP